MLDSRGFIHVPTAVRRTALSILALVCVSAIYLTARYAYLDDPKDPKYADWILVGMSLVHMSLAGFAIALLLFFTEKDVSTDVLLKKTDAFLEELLPQVLQRVSPSYALRHKGSEVVKLGRSDIFGAAYELSCDDKRIQLWVGLNVSRLIVIYWVVMPVDKSSVEAMTHFEKIYQYTFGGAKKVGFTTHFEPFTSPSGVQIMSIWSSIKLEQNLLLQPSDRLFWMQDIAMMTESFWRTSLRHGVALSREEPSPL
jgi:hypothetical protein